MNSFKCGAPRVNTPACVWNPFLGPHTAHCPSLQSALFSPLLHKAGNEGLEKKLMFDKCIKEHFALITGQLVEKTGSSPPQELGLVGWLSHRDTMCFSYEIMRP